MDGGTGGGIAGSGGGAGTANTVTGMVNGRAITAASAAAQRIRVYVQTGGSSSVTHEGLVVRLSESSAVCNTSGPVGVAATDKRVVTLRIDLAPDAGVVGNGQFTGSLIIAVPDCSMTTASGSGPVSMLQSFEQSGAANITLTETTAKVRGTFTATLSSGAPISGSFDADFCNFYDWEVTQRVQCK
jgi:hypothetical protein